MPLPSIPALVSRMPFPRTPLPRGQCQFVGVLDRPCGLKPRSKWATDSMDTVTLQSFPRMRPR